MWSRLPMWDVDLRKAPGVLDRGAYAVAPGTLVLPSRSCEGSPGQLLCIEAVAAFLRRILPLRERAGQRFGLKIISEPGHVTIMGARVCECSGHAWGKRMVVHRFLLKEHVF
jgi:hypothetical protein